MASTIDAGETPIGPGAGPAPVAPDQAPGAPALAPSIAQAIQNAVNAAPELKNDPGTAVAVAAAGGTAVKAQAVAQAGKRQANATAQDQVAPTGTGIFGDIADIGETALSKVAHYANDGLSTVQHEYRYLHAVEATHGMTAAIMEGAGMLAGGVAGSLIDPGEGTILGAEAATYIEGQLAYRNLWQQTLNPNYRDPHTGQLVSFGRDISSVLGLHGGAKTAVSGALDGLGDMIADPLGLVGKGLGEAHSVEGMGGLLGKVYQGTSITAENVDQAYDTLPSIRRAFSDIAGMTAGDIGFSYPQFKGVAKELGAASTAEQVRDTFKELAASSEMLDAKQLPTLSASRMAFRPIGQIMRNLPDGAEMEGLPGFAAKHVLNNSVIGPRRWADRFNALPGTTFDPATMDISGTQINPANTRGLTDLGNMVRYSGTDREAWAVMDAYAWATPAQRIVIAKNTIFRTLFRMAGERLGPNDDPEAAISELVDARTKKAILDRLDNHLSSAAMEGNQPERVFGTMVDGKVIRPVLDDEGVRIQGAVRANQTGNISLPNIVEARRMAQAISKARISPILAGVDDFLYNYVTQGFFKPLVLMSGGYGLHISLAEAIPNALRHGLTTTVKGLYDRAVANLGYQAEIAATTPVAWEGTVEEGFHPVYQPLKGLAGFLYNVAGSRALENSTDAQYLTEVYLANEGYKTTTGVAAGEITQGETQPVERALSGFRQKMASGTKEGAEFSTFGNEDPRIVKLWQADLREAANDKWTRTAAQAYLDAATRPDAVTEELPDEIPPSLFRHRPQGSSTLSALTSGPLYRESSAQDALDTVSGQSAGLSGPVRKYWSNDRDLALGQGESRGVVVEKEGSHLHGDVDMRKPGAEFEASEGRAEFQAAHWRGGSEGQLGGGGIRSVEIKPEALAHQPYTQDERMSGFQKPPDRQFSNMESNSVGSLRRQLDRAGYRKFELSNGGERWVRSDLVRRTASGRATEAAATEDARQAVAEQLRQEPQDVLDNFVRSRYKSYTAPPGWDAIDDWASAIVDALKTDVHARGVNGAAGKLHADLLTSVANGRVPSADELDKIDPTERPLALKGRQVIPDGTGTVQRIANIGFSKILNPMVNILSRNQEFAVEYVEARRVLQGQVDAGLMTDDQAMVRAEAQATTHVMRFVHNLHDRTQWTATMRNWAPFYFAQEQAYRRMGRLLAEDPGAFRRYQMAIAGIGHISAQMQDSSGNRYIVFPGSGFLGKGVADMMGMHGVMVGNVTPAAFGGSLSSANVIFPLSQGFSPDLGPVAMVAADQLSTHLPELGKRYPQFSKVTNVAASALNYVQGESDQSESIWEQLIPNTFVQRIVQAYSGDDRAFNSSVMQAYQYLDYQQAEATDAWKKDGSKGPAPSIIPAQNAPASVRQAFVDKVRNYVRALYVARAITGLVSPVSSDVEITNFGFPAKLNEEIEQAGSVSTGMSNFLLKYPNVVPWTVAESYVPSNTDQTQPEGYSLSSSQPAMNWTEANQGLLNQYGPAALWLMPQLKGATYSSTVYNEQIAEGLRVKDTPQQFLNALYVAAGDDLYYDGLSVHEAALTAAGNDSTAVNAEYSNWDAWVAQVEKQYPVWAEDFTSGVRQTNAQQTIQTLTQIFKDNQAPAGEQSDLVAQLLAQYQTAAAAYQQAGTTSDYYSAQSAVSDSWVAYVDGLAAQFPQLKPIIQSVFKNALKVQT